MEITEPRIDVARGALRLPPAPLPRPGDSVTWHQGPTRQRGRLVGHSPDTRPYVQQRDGTRYIDNFEMIRLDDGADPVGPNWSTLPDRALLVRPRPGEQAAFSQLLNGIIPPGVRHRELIEEVHNFGFEIFLAGATVRDVLTQRQTLDAELVTTMPLDRLYALVVSMYGVEPVRMGQYDRLAGCLWIGRTQDATGPFLVVRLFRHHGLLGTKDVVFGADFTNDIGYGDFACGALYFDPVNEVLIDPTGLGIADVESRVLRPVYDVERRDPRQIAHTALRMICLKLRGYQVTPEHSVTVTRILEQLPALTEGELAAAVETEVLCDVAAGPERAAHPEEIRKAFIEFDAEELYQKYVGRHAERLCGGTA